MRYIAALAPALMLLGAGAVPAQETIERWQYTAGTKARYEGRVAVRQTIAGPAEMGFPQETRLAMSLAFRAEVERVDFLGNAHLVVTTERLALEELAPGAAPARPSPELAPAADPLEDLFDEMFGAPAAPEAAGDEGGNEDEGAVGAEDEGTEGDADAEEDDEAAGAPGAAMEQMLEQYRQVFALVEGTRTRLVVSPRGRVLLNRVEVRSLFERLGGQGVPAGAQLFLAQAAADLVTNVMLWTNRGQAGAEESGVIMPLPRGGLEDALITETVLRSIVPFAPRGHTRRVIERGGDQDEQVSIEDTAELTMGGVLWQRETVTRTQSKKVVDARDGFYRSHETTQQVDSGVDVRAMGEMIGTVAGLAKALAALSSGARDPQALVETFTAARDEVLREIPAGAALDVRQETSVTLRRTDG